MLVIVQSVFRRKGKFRNWLIDWAVRIAMNVGFQYVGDKMNEKQLSLNSLQSRNKLKRPIIKSDIESFLNEYLESNLTELALFIMRDAIIEQLTKEEAIKIANNDKYPVSLIEKELKHTTDKLISIATVLGGLLFAKIGGGESENS